MICKITKKKLKPIMSFGKMPIANGFVSKDNFKKEYFFDMDVGFSEDLSLFQLYEHPKPEIMFNQNYPFFSGSSEYMKLHFKEYANFIKKNYLKSNSKIIEIGSNDGTMLKNFINLNENVVGFEPSKNVATRAAREGIKTLNQFFNHDNVQDLKNFIKKTDIIYASNVICHIPDLNDLIKAIDLLLNNNGTFIFEEPYLGSMFKKVSYDQIYDEHIYMFSLSSIDKIFKHFDFELIEAFPQITHGGSMRYIIKRKGKNKKSSNLINLLDKEKEDNIDNAQSSIIFRQNCEKSRDKIHKKIKELKIRNKKICGYAATSKSTTILNYCKIGPDIIDYICDTTPEKIGKYSPGMHIPIVSMEYFYKNLPDNIYLFAWNHKDEILKKEKNFKGEWFSHVTL